MGEYQYSNFDKSSKNKRAKKLGYIGRGIIESDERMRKRAPKKKGPRTIFLEKYQQNQDFEKAKQEMADNGFNPEIYGDKTLQNWIDEER